MSKTWTRNDLIEKIHSKVGVSMTDSSKLIEDIFDEIMISLESGNDVKLSSFGTFLIKSKKSRIGRNPKTKETKMISSREVVLFKPSKEFKEFVNLKDNG